MDVVWWLLGFSAFGALICGKARAAMPAALFTGLAVVLFLLTPAGQSTLTFVTDLFGNVNAANSTGGAR